MLRLLVCLFLIPLHTLACTEPGIGFLPENNRRISPEFKSGLTLEQYNAAIDKFIEVYSPIVKKYDAELVIERKWESETVNAGTLRTNQGKTWVVNLYGGFARHPFITPDGYMLVICHEIGHHIGGAPKKRFPETGVHWASTEGQADYFATLKCLRKIFRKDDNQAAIRDLDVPENTRSECAEAHPTPSDSALCIRSSMAGISVAKVNADIRRVPLPVIEIVDSTIVDTTSNNHPAPQCRLNTYYQGAICPVPATRTLSQVNEAKATCHQTSGHTIGLRPSCWHNPVQ